MRAETIARQKTYLILSFGKIDFMADLTATNGEK